MVNRPRLVSLDRTLLPGLLALAIFGLLSLTVLTASFGEAAGFPDVSIVSGIGYALLGDPAAAGEALVFEHTESFLVALILVAVVLDAALDGAVMLASRDEGGEE